MKTVTQTKEARKVTHKPTCHLKVKMFKDKQGMMFTVGYAILVLIGLIALVLLVNVN